MTNKEFEEILGNVPFEDIEKIQKYIQENYISRDEIYTAIRILKSKRINVIEQLDCIEKKDREIEKLEKQSKVIDRQAQKYFEQTIYLNKIIDLMADFMYKTGTGRKALSCVFRQNDECNENGCRYCIKQYFADLVEKE